LKPSNDFLLQTVYIQGALEGKGITIAHLKTLAELED